MSSMPYGTLRDIANELKNIREILKKQSTTEQSSIVGEWQWESEEPCDNCGYEIPHLERVVGETVLMDSKDWKYCPNCGNKRKGADHE